MSQAAARAESGRVADRDARVLVLAATAKDSALASVVLTDAGIDVECCPDMRGLASAVRAGAAALMVAEEALAVEDVTPVSQFVAEQPPWSDIPVLVLARPGGGGAAELADLLLALGNVTLLERPLRVATLLSAVRTALRARQRQYEIRRHLLERARTETLLRQADQRKDEFLATLGHELRNPLAPLVTALHLLKCQTPAGDTDVLAVMDRQLQHLTRLVDDLLEVSRVTRGLIELRREPVDLRTVLQAAIETARPAIADAGHDLHVDVGDRPVTVHGDVVRLTQVFANLLGNATKYTDRGGRIDVSVRVRDARAVVAVRDTGIGIPVNELGAVFEMFTQVNRLSRRSQGGLGIGLTLVRSLVTMHGGRVEARSDGVGTGSEFVVELPMAQVEQGRTAGPASLGTVPPFRILVVDDNSDAADTLGTLLDVLGATVAVSNGGAEALELAESFTPDVVVLDIGMPGMDGYEVARRLRAQPAHARTVLVALTGWGQDRDQQRARASGFDHHMIKPLDVAALRDVLWHEWRARAAAPRNEAAPTPD